MSLLRDTIARLEAEAIPHALTGAPAMAVHGVSRSTADVDLLSRLPADARRLCSRIESEERSIDSFAPFG
jgi:hypothetical protein